MQAKSLKTHIALCYKLVGEGGSVPAVDSKTRSVEDLRSAAREREHLRDALADLPLPSTLEQQRAAAVMRLDHQAGELRERVAVITRWRPATAAAACR
jgi:hypothetical protein